MQPRCAAGCTIWVCVRVHGDVCTMIKLPNDAFLRKCFFFFKQILFIFRERGREGEREGEKHQCVVASHTPPEGTWPATQACVLNGNRTSDPLGCRQALNPPSHTSQGHKHIFVSCRLISLTRLCSIYNLITMFHSHNSSPSGSHSQALPNVTFLKVPW